MEELLSSCNLCPHGCKVDRNNGRLGRCKMGKLPKIALISTHMFEEPCISGKKGSGTIFFTGCNLSCLYCQNHEISQGGKGKEATIERLADIMLEQQKRNVSNINLVTPTIYIAQIIEAIKISRKKGLVIPIVYNSSGYESVEILKLLEGYIDIYLPDLKYASDEIGEKYSKVEKYFSRAAEAILEMRRQVQDTYEKDGIMKTGLIVRHMILPNNIDNSKEVIKWIREKLGKETVISIMAQYFPTYKAKNIEKINRKITAKELKEVEDYIYKLEFENGYIQELGEHEEEYVPVFDMKNV